MKFALVEDQVMFRMMMRNLLVDRCKGQIVFEAGSLAEVRPRLAELARADILLLDIRLPDGDGVAFVEELGQNGVAVPVLLLSSSAEDYVVHRISRSTAQGFVHKDDDPKILVTAIQMIAAGGSYFSPRYKERLRQLSSSPASFAKLLSPREQELLRYFGSGYSDAEIAPILGLSVKTVETHRHNVMSKLDLHTAQELQAYALKAGFTTVDQL